MCSCESTKTSSCSTKSSCACSVTEDVVLVPKVIKPFTTTEEASNKYSVDVTVFPRAGRGRQSTTYNKQATGANTAALVANVHQELIAIVIDVIKSVIADATYVGPDPTTFVEATHLVSVTTLNAFLTGSYAVPANFPYIEYVAQVVFTVFTQIKNHIETASAAPTSVSAICATGGGGGGKVTKIAVENCLFGLNLIYN